MSITPNDGLVFKNISQRLNKTYENKGLCSEAIDRRRFGKLAEELGEVQEAYDGMVGENPRKGVWKTREDLLKELLDVAGGALAAYEHFDGHHGRALGALLKQADYVDQRLKTAIANPPVKKVCTCALAMNRESTLHQTGCAYYDDALDSL